MSCGVDIQADEETSCLGETSYKEDELRSRRSDDQEDDPSAGKDGE